MLKTTRVQFANKLYYLKSNKAPRKIQPRPYSPDYFMPKEQNGGLFQDVKNLFAYLVKTCNKFLG